MKVVTRSKVSVFHIGNDEVPQIRKVKQPKKLNQTKEKTNKLSIRFKTEIKKSSHNKGTVVPINLLEVDDDDDDTVEKKETGFHNVYGFKSNKRRNQLENFASESIQKKTGVVESRPKRKVVNPRVADDDEEDEDEDTDDEETTELTPNNGKHAVMPVAAENDLYFKSHNNKKKGNSTSNHTLKKLKCRKLDHDEVVSTLKNLPSTSSARKIEQGKKLLRQRNALTFDEWLAYLDESYNILLYGLGSKRGLVHSFCNSMLQNSDKLVVNGFFPRVSIKSILSNICADVIQLPSYPMEVEEMTRLVCDHYNEAEADHLYLIIHNIDGIRAQRSQLIISRLAASPGIHVIASIDHINASLIWDHKITLNFNWLTFDATTFESYKAETAHEGSLALQGTTGASSSGGLVLSGLLHVTESLTRNARACFRLLVEDHLDDEAGSDDVGMSFTELYRRCREKFFVNSELNLRAHLTEFIDHKLLLMRKNPDGGDYLQVPLDRAVLAEYLEQD